MPRPIVIGIAGGSGSGKTHLARRIAEATPSSVSILSMDQYFRTEATGEPANVNFDHPAHLDLDLMLGHLMALKEGCDVLAPAYDFRAMRQTPEAVTIEARAVVLVDGLFVLAEPFASRLDMSLFLDVEDDQRLLGRILRDVQERDATISQIVDRYQRFVRPSYNVFVEPSKQNADLVVDFTYRRALLAELLIHVVRDHGLGLLNLRSLLQAMNSNRYQIGFEEGESVLGTNVDIRQLAQAYAEASVPVRLSASE